MTVPRFRHWSRPFTGLWSVVAALVGLVILVGATAAWQVSETRATRRDLVLEGNLTSARIAAQAVGLAIESRLELVGGLARRPDLQQIVASKDWSTSLVYLQGMRGLDTEIISAAVFDAEGRLWARDPADPSVVGANFVTRNYFQGALATQGPYLSEVFVQKGTPQKTVVAFASAVRDPTGKTIGVLQATLPISFFGTLTEAIEVPNQGSIQVFDQTDHALTGSAAGPTERFRSSPPVARAKAGDFGVGEFAVPGLGGKRLVAFAPVPEVRWSVLVEQPPSVALRPTRDLIWRLSGIVALVILIALLSGLFVVRLLRQLARERRRVTAILSSIADGVVTVDPEKGVLSINPALERLSGWSTREILGRPYFEVFRLFDDRGEFLEPEREYLAKAMESGKVEASRGYGLMLMTKDGRRTPVGVAGAPVLDERGALLGGVAIVRDLSQEREVDQMKSALISTVSHELRTPLTMIQGFSELLLERDLDEKRSREALERINSSAERLSRMVESLLSVSRIESGRVVARVGLVDLSELVQEVVGSFAHRDGREFRSDLEEDLPAVVGDRDMLVQILTNLVSNAAKYSPAEAPVIIHAERTGESVEISITDKGIGLTDSQAEKLFEKFYRVDRQEVREVGGTGLGLYITKHLVELQGGQIWVRSRAGSGSTFAFSLPVAAESREEVRA